MAVRVSRRYIFRASFEPVIAATTAQRRILRRRPLWKVHEAFSAVETIFRSPESSPFSSGALPRESKGSGKYRNVPECAARATPYKSRGCNPAETVHYGGTNRGNRDNRET